MYTRRRNIYSLSAATPTDRTGHKSALLVMSGTMGNQVAIRTHLTQAPYSVLCDHRAHILISEAGGVSAWTGATTIPVIPANGLYLTLEDILSRVVLSNNIHHCPTKLVSLENTLHGLIIPLDEMRRIVDWAHENGIPVHLDGARVWDAVVATSGRHSLAEHTSMFDSVSLCFSKGLGAPIGSMIVGSKGFIDRARWSIGGGIRQAGVIAAPARVAVDEVFGVDSYGMMGRMRGTHQRVRRIAALWTERGGRVLLPVQTGMVWLHLDAAGIDPSFMREIGGREGVRLSERRLVVHHQISDATIQRLTRVFDVILKKTTPKL
ncbi:l-allo-threonine aldolase [Aspergillus sclerotiicarbonarius CBS 121057]|uniref:L-allo-threonine aldolase n=1 Tax=Aspergillus sclerotiicarbonarius (strain CBS 121057 / IBT 28362) TaxID=1448318 RepID=A0A319EI94_ASPSB|nr:l-allo-threonine aldolase [Aspergillus sclerotiicarbonarius CBS 121057]